MQKLILGETSEGNNIYVNLIWSPAGQYLNRHPHLFAVIEEMLSMKALSGKSITIEQDMGRNIGTSDIVTITDDDTIYYAQGVKSDIFSTFVRNRAPQASAILTVIAMQDADGNYEVRDTWIGANHPPFPGEDHATATSKIYWQTHALVRDAHAIQSKTITKVCPYL
jgi:hypothetical protein